jgi:taurine--2-oxoglutarate transaminase
VHFFGPFLYRSPFHSSDEHEESERALEHLRHVVEFEGPSTIAAIVLETIPGTAGIMLPPPGYLAGVRQICDEFGIVYIADEVMAGFGRTGRWFAFEHYDVVPDLITFAKGVNSGYVPLGGVVISDAIAATFARRVYPGGLTYSGHPLACAAAVATMNAMTEEGVVENAARIGEHVLRPGLTELAERHPSIGEVRGLGVFFALDLVKDRTTKEPMAPYGGSSPAMDELVRACKVRGLLPFTNYNRLHVVPPCTVSDEEARAGLAILDEALAVTDAAAAGD